MNDLNCNFYYEPPVEIRKISKKRRKIIESIGGTIDKDDTHVSFDISIPNGSIRFIYIDFSKIDDESIIKYTLDTLYLKGADFGKAQTKKTIQDYVSKL